MPIRWHRTALVRGRAILAVLCLLLLPPVVSPVFAQETTSSSGFGQIAKRTVLDPTTYAPAILAYDATMRDWNTSQTFFANGYLERNSRFTITGKANDVAIGYEAGRRRILLDSLSILELSLGHNAATNLLERALIERHPARRKLIRTLGWIERISFNAYLTYRLAGPHYRQAAANVGTAAQLGLK